MDAEEAEKVAAKAMAGQLTLADFLARHGRSEAGLHEEDARHDQVPRRCARQIENFDERGWIVEAIVRSMTPAEREDVSILNGSSCAYRPWFWHDGHRGRSAHVRASKAAREMIAGNKGRWAAACPAWVHCGRGGKAKQKANARKAQAQRARMKERAFW